MLTAYKTDIGLTRMINEDRVLVQEELNGFTLAIVADGMGGHQAGDVASEMAIQLLHEQLHHLERDMTLEQLEQLLQQTFQTVNAQIYERSLQKPEFEGMGTTVVVAVATERQVVIGNIGDSRAYVLQDGQLTQLTEDHSLVSELLRTGQISEADSEIHPQRNVLTRALGTESSAKIDLYHLDWYKEQILLLCSDGLTNHVDDEMIADILLEETSLQQRTDRLINTALEAGGKDNISVVLLANEDKQKDGLG